MEGTLTQMDKIRFPANLYVDIRVEDNFSSLINFENGTMKQNKQKNERGAFIRVFDGRRWYFQATTDLDRLQEAIGCLSAMAAPNGRILEHPVIRKLEVHQDRLFRFQDQDIRNIPRADKLDLLHAYLPISREYKEIRSDQAIYLDRHAERHFLSSLGANVTYDYQNCAVIIRYDLDVGGKPASGREYVSGSEFKLLAGQPEHFTSTIEKDIDFARLANPVVPGIYTCILSPAVTGVFAHESFGHKSEADFMAGDEAMMREWAIGGRVGAPGLNIIDSGLLEGDGYVPYDDEGCKARKNYLIKDGILTGRLHSSQTAAALAEMPTGNARAVNFEYEPIVRMTTTYIEAGNMTREQLINSTVLGIFIDDLKHGSGMTTFTIAPKRAYMIRDGSLAEPIEISVITGNVMETLHEIDGLSDQVELFSMPLGGCGKMEQNPLRVGFGGPHMRVRGINVK